MNWRLLVVLSIGCAGSPNGDIDDPIGGKGDDGTSNLVAGLEEGSPEALAVLAVANEADAMTLDDEVGLRSNAVDALIDARPFESLAELLTVRNVGEGAIRQLFAYADLSGGLVYRAVPAEPARVVAIGDLHGDSMAASDVLQLAGIIDADGAWAGEDTVVVQVGDILDRGDGEAEIVELVQRLEREAEAAGGAYLMLLGNHELMNADGDFRYVTEDGLSTFGEAPAEGYDEYDASERARAAAFLPGGSVARFLARHDVVTKVGDTLFAHAGVLPHHVEYGLQQINHDARAFLIFEGMDMPAILDADDGPVWYRGYGTDEDTDCALVDETLAATGSERMVIGHTVQSDGISWACDGRLYRVDVGLSEYYGGGVQALEIVDGETYVLSYE